MEEKQAKTCDESGSKTKDFKMVRGILIIIIIIIVIILIILIIIYIYHTLINALSAHMIHSNLNTIICTHVENCPTKTIYIK